MPKMQLPSSLGDIHEVNLSYLILAQRLLRDNLAEGMFRLGVCEDVAAILLKLSPAQLVSMATTSQLLCGFRLNDRRLLSALAGDTLDGVLQHAHSTILLSRQQNDASASEDNN